MVSRGVEGTVGACRFVCTSPHNDVYAIMAEGSPFLDTPMTWQASGGQGGVGSPIVDNGKQFVISVPNGGSATWRDFLNGSTSTSTCTTPETTETTFCEAGCFAGVSDSRMCSGEGSCFTGVGSNTASCDCDDGRTGTYCESEAVADPGDDNGTPGGGGEEGEGATENDSSSSSTESAVPEGEDPNWMVIAMFGLSGFAAVMGLALVARYMGNKKAEKVRAEFLADSMSPTSPMSQASTFGRTPAKGNSSGVSYVTNLKSGGGRTSVASIATTSVAPPPPSEAQPPPPDYATSTGRRTSGTGSSRGSKASKGSKGSKGRPKSHRSRASVGSRGGRTSIGSAGQKSSGEALQRMMKGRGSAAFTERSAAKEAKKKANSGSYGLAFEDEKESTGLVSLNGPSEGSNRSGRSRSKSSKGGRRSSKSSKGTKRASVSSRGSKGRKRKSSKSIQRRSSGGGK